MSWLGAIVIGGIAGWLAEQFMKSNMGLFMNVILGIVGAVVLNFILNVLGAQNYTATDSWSWSYLIVGFIGACLLIAVARMFRGRRV